MLVKRTLPSKFEIKTEHDVLFETLRLCADAIRLFQAIDPRLPQVAPLDARMFQVISINWLLEGQRGAALDDIFVSVPNKKVVGLTRFHLRRSNITETLDSPQTGLPPTLWARCTRFDQHWSRASDETSLFSGWEPSSSSGQLPWSSLHSDKSFSAGNGETQLTRNELAGKVANCCRLLWQSATFPFEPRYQCRKPQEPPSSLSHDHGHDHGHAPCHDRVQHEAAPGETWPPNLLMRLCENLENYFCALKQT